MTSLPVLGSVATPDRLLRPLHGCAAGELGFDVAEGCGASCIHCSGGYASEAFGEKNAVRVLPDVAVRLQAELEELAGIGRRPTRIRMGLRSDPLWPVKELQDATLACLKVAVERGVGVELHTRSVVPDAVAALLLAHASMVQVVLSVMTARESAALVYEPGLTPPAGRVRSLRALAGHGVGVRLRVEPLVPLVNDTGADLEAVLDLAAKNGVKRVEFAYLQMTPAAAKSLSRGLPRMHREMLKGLFAAQPWEDGPRGQRKLLPAVLRQAGYERALDLARKAGVHATICACSEPELASQVCHRVAGEPGAPPPSGSQWMVLDKPVSVKPAAQQLGLFAEAVPARARRGR